MRLYEVVVDIYERATEYRYPVVTHIFRGASPKEAWGMHEAHRKSDSFLRACEDEGVFHGSVHCRTSVREGWTERR